MKLKKVCMEIEDRVHLAKQFLNLAVVIQEACEHSPNQFNPHESMFILLCLIKEHVEGLEELFKACEEAANA